MLQAEKIGGSLEFLRVPMNGVESVTSMVMVKTGSRYEQEEDYGVAHFLEHMVFRGTKKFPGKEVITRRIDGIGAEFNAFTSEEMTAFYVRSAGKDVEIALETLGEMTTQMLIRDEDVQKERGVILEELHMYEDEPRAYNAQEFNKMFYGTSGLAHDIVGTRESIKKIERENFLRFIDRWYRPKNMLIIIAGKKSTVESKELSKKIEQYFNFRKFTSEEYKQEDYWEKDYKYGGKVNFIDRKTEQTHFILGWPSIDRFSKQDAVLSVLQTILGGNMSSRLFSEVREKRGLCYYVFAQTENFCDSGFLGAASGVNPDKLVDAVKVTVGEFEGLASGEKKITAEELRRAKNYLMGQMTLAQESVYSLAHFYGAQYLFEKKVRSVADELKRIEKVTSEQVVKLAAQIADPKQLRFSAIGQISDRQRQEITRLVER